MSYIDGYVIAVPTRNRAAYEDLARRMVPLFKKHGATGMVETWGNDVPGGKLTSFPLAVQAKEDESVVFSWITWPDKDSRDKGWKAVLQEPEMDMEAAEHLFDGKRMIFGGFDVIVEA